MSSPNVDLLLANPPLLSIAPLILAAWDDEFLTPAELLKLREAMAQAAGVQADELATLRGWLDPEAPPSTAELGQLRRALAKRTGPEADDAERDSWSTRLEAVRRHLLLPLKRAQASAGTAARSFAALSDEQVARLRAALDADSCEMRDEVRQLLSEHAVFRERADGDTRAQRELVLEQCRVLASLSLFRSASGSDSASDSEYARSVRDFAATFESVALFDLSLVVKFGVQFGLFANAIQKLGSAQHRVLLPETRRCELLGCFAMTERGHGSNVRGIETRADYDAKTQEFVIHTPRLSAGKEWIGSAALHAREAVVFAQLFSAGEHHGVHAFLVPIRDRAGALLKGVRAEDCGHKMGLNGVDNGRLWFEQVRVPRSSLLDRFGQVAQDGSYASSIPSQSKRFFVMLGSLVAGRINVAGGALAASKLGLAITLRYSALRRQFPDQSGQEQPLLGYQMHHLRLLPALAHAYALSFAQQALVRRLTRMEAEPSTARETEMLANGLKAVGTWRAIETLQMCRECCGGQGYLTSNRLDPLRTDTDVFTTFEGDNTVLCQQVGKERLRVYMAERSPLDAPARSAAVRDNPVDATEPLSQAWCEALIQARDERLIEALFERIQRRIGAGMDAQAAFEECQDHTLSLTRAHMTRFAAASFREAVGAEPLLRELYQLFCVASLHADAGWFLEAGMLTPEQARQLRKRLRAQVEEVACNALSYAEAFGIPEICMGPLADPSYLLRSGLITRAS